MFDTLNAQHLVKQRIALIAYLRGAQMHNALRVFYLAEKRHNGVRKDGVTPEFAHQVQIALFFLTLNLPQDILEIALIAALAHDLFEDFPDMSPQGVLQEIEQLMQMRLAAEDVAILQRGLAAAMDLSKIQNGVKLEQDVYLKKLAISSGGIAALGKGVDRLNNFQSMCGVFSPEKIRQYLEEGMGILACLKQARKNFPLLANSYLNVEYALKSQIELISIMLDIHPRVSQKEAEAAALPGMA